jgi:hypothetical protein
MLAVVVAAIAGCIAAGCAPNATISFSSMVRPRNVVPIDRLLVVASVKGWAFEPKLYNDFETALSHRLKSCGVTSRVWYVDPKIPDETSRFRNALKEFQPSAVMAMKDTEDYSEHNKSYTIGVLLSSSLNTHEVSSSFWTAIIIGLVAGMIPHYAEIKIFSTLTLFDAGSAMTMWQARSEFNFVTGNALVNDWKSVVTLATGIASQLRRDGVLKRCPASWPNLDALKCMTERRRALQEASRLADPAARATAVRAAPVCD